MTWLNVKGHREFQLDRTMKLWWDYIVPGMKKRQTVSGYLPKPVVRSPFARTEQLAHLFRISLLALDLPRRAPVVGRPRVKAKTLSCSGNRTWLGGISENLANKLLFFEGVFFSMLRYLQSFFVTLCFLFYFRHSFLFSLCHHHKYSYTPNFCSFPNRRCRYLYCPRFEYDFDGGLVLSG